MFVLIFANQVKALALVSVLWVLAVFLFPSLPKKVTPAMASAQGQKLPLLKALVLEGFSDIALISLLFKSCVIHECISSGP